MTQITFSFGRKIYNVLFKMSLTGPSRLTEEAPPDYYSLFQHSMSVSDFNVEDPELHHQYVPSATAKFEVAKTVSSTQTR